MTLPPLTIIPAAAGSGKTYKIQTTLTEWVQQKKIRPERIIAVTFTEAAANELRERIRMALLADANVKMEQVLALDQAYITTIHGFGLRLLQEYCFEGGWSPHPRLLNEDEGDILIRQALTATRKADKVMTDLAHFGYRWNSFKGSAEDQFRKTLSNLIQKHRVIGFDALKMPEKIKTHLLQEIKKVYGPTGKAAVIEKKLEITIKNLLEKFPDSLTDLFPDNKSYVQAKRNDYHKLQMAYRKDGLKDNWPLWKLLQNLRISKRGSALSDGYDDLATKVMAAAGQLYRHPGPRDQALTHAEALVDAAQDCLQQHSTLKRDKRLVDYGDMLSLAQSLLTKNENVLQDLKGKVDCVVIDEFQDTNPLQFSLFLALISQNIPTLIVGDTKQAIMGFQDADARLLESLGSSGRASGAPLVENWRTVEPLMNFLNSVGCGLFPKEYQSLTPRITQKSEIEPLQIVNFSNSLQNQAMYGDHIAGHIKSILTSKKRVQENGVYRTLRGNDIAILLPTHKLIEIYANSCRKYGLAVRVDEPGWFASRSVQLLYYGLLFVADQEDRHAALYLSVTELGQNNLQESLYNLINDQDLNDPILKALSERHKTIVGQDVYSLVHAVINDLDLYATISNWPDAAQERANILRFSAAAQEFIDTNPETLEAAGLYGFGLKTFLAWFRKKEESDNLLPRAQIVAHNAITLSTWHSAKGKEWPIVALCGTFKEYNAKLPSLDIQYQDFTQLDNILEQAVIEFSPDFVANESSELFKKPLQIEAEKNARRLLYVALTRAKEQLILERAGYQEKKAKLSYWNLLMESTGISFADKTLNIGDKEFSIEQVTIAKEEAEVAPLAAQDPPETLSNIGIRAINRQPLPGLTPESLTPSQLSPKTEDKKDKENKKDKRVDLLKVKTYKYGSPLELDLGKEPSETGTILHRCFEVLTPSEDRTQKLDDATGYTFSNEQKIILQNAVVSFENWCQQTFGNFTLYKELPITYQDDNGIIISGIIDLLIETKDGCWIIDHKSRKPDNPEKELINYWPQLQAYQQGLEQNHKVLGVGINWLLDSAVSII